MSSAKPSRSNSQGTVVLNEAAPAGWWLLVIGLLLIPIGGMAESTPTEWSLVLVAAVLCASLGAAMLLARPRLTLDLTTRQLHYRRNRLPWGKQLRGSMESHLRGLQAGPKPCGSRRQCISEFGVWIVFAADEERLQIRHLSSLEDAMAEARTLADEWGLPLLDGKA